MGIREEIDETGDCEEGAGSGMDRDDDTTDPTPAYHAAQWPQSFRQSMDIYRNLPSPDLTIIGPGLQRLGSSYLSSSFRRCKISPDVTTDLSQPLILSNINESEPIIHDRFPLIFCERQPTRVVDAGPQGNCTEIQAIFNGINLLCGVGILSIPYALKEGGWLGFITLFTIAIVAWSTGLLLRDCLESQEGLEIYPDIGHAAFGMAGRIFISILLYPELYAICVEFLILEGDNLVAVLPSMAFNYNSIRLESAQVFTIMIGLIMLPTALLRDLKMLSYISVFSVISSIVVVICVGWVGAIDGVGFHHNGQAVNISNLPITVGLYGFCYSGHSVFPNIYSSLRDRSRFPLVLMASIVICTTMYVGVAIMGFTMSGDATPSQITLKLPQQYLASKFAVGTAVVNPFTKYALTITPVALSLEELIPSTGENMRNYCYCILIRVPFLYFQLFVLQSRSPSLATHADMILQDARNASEEEGEPSKEGDESSDSS